MKQTLRFAAGQIVRVVRGHADPEVLPQGGIVKILVVVHSAAVYWTPRPQSGYIVRFGDTPCFPYVWDDSRFEAV